MRFVFNCTELVEVLFVAFVANFFFLLLELSRLFQVSDT